MHINENQPRAIDRLAAGGGPRADRAAPSPMMTISQLTPRHREAAGLPQAWSTAGEGVVAQLFSVRPCPSGWRVQSDGLEPLVFARGGHAERQARRLAKGVARLGRDAKVNVYDARGDLAGAISFYARRSPPDPDASRRYPWAH